MNAEEFKRRDTRARRVLHRFMLSIVFGFFGLVWFCENVPISLIPWEASLFVFLPASFSAVTVIDAIYRILGWKTA